MDRPAVTNWFSASVLRRPSSSSLASCCLDLLEPQFADLGPDALELRAEGLSCGIWLHSEPEDLMGRINQVLNIDMP
jgi:hypothetical protein